MVDESETQSHGKDQSTSRGVPEPSWFRNPIKRWNNMNDYMRVRRLGNCQELKDILQQCRDQKPDRRPLEDSSLGLRNAHHYSWVGHEPADPTSCVREEYALWTCRAISLKCGQFVMDLRECVNEHERTAMADQKRTYFDPPESPEDQVEDADAPCRNIQRKLGDCVVQNTKGLEARLRQRRLEARKA